MTVALIGACGLVLVALIGLVSAAMSRSSKTSESPPAADRNTGERLAITETLVKQDRRTLDVLDHHVDNIGDNLDRLTWRFDDLLARFEEHMRRHHGGR